MEMNRQSAVPWQAILHSQAPFVFAEGGAVEIVAVLVAAAHVLAVALPLRPAVGQTAQDVAVRHGRAIDHRGLAVGEAAVEVRIAADRAVVGGDAADVRGVQAAAVLLADDPLERLRVRVVDLSVLVEIVARIGAAGGDLLLEQVEVGEIDAAVAVQIAGQGGRAFSEHPAARSARTPRISRYRFMRTSSLPAGRIYTPVQSPVL